MLICKECEGVQNTGQEVRIVTCHECELEPGSYEEDK
jgi:hypothetical protein